MEEKIESKNVLIASLGLLKAHTQTHALIPILEWKSKPDTTVRTRHYVRNWKLRYRGSFFFLQIKKKKGLKSVFSCHLHSEIFIGSAFKQASDPGLWREK